MCNTYSPNIKFVKKKELQLYESTIMSFCKLLRVLFITIQEKNQFHKEAYELFKNSTRCTAPNVHTSTA